MENTHKVFSQLIDLMNELFQHSTPTVNIESPIGLPLSLLLTEKFLSIKET